MRSITCTAVCVALAAILIMIVTGPQTANAVTCQVTQLAPCAAAITSSAPPSKQCCMKMKEQRPCLCQYIKNPSLKAYVSSPNAKKVSKTCGVPVPKC
ncbi:Bifunctional inhibitor/plant lipid transfer protein/seed storage helical domain-containing protein [Artemisia annua]|uniref:Bifunctional inhibitor/plant lipid transfer protein/seed storage helical domain-containing protein n=1 Tax=Artemisia annua TaxID=35608 RepID=A0A2U1LRV9_ARTAN|nr:Bifunctional inhibitor/plant lipid transfer protein/seed storage helical domain-containing protein [Artemisia annua]